MSDDPTKRTPADRIRINIHEEYELGSWSRTFGVTRWEVKAAVKRVGPVAKDVAEALGSRARI